MAKSPKSGSGNAPDQRKEKEAAEEEVLMREVEEAVRQDRLAEFGRKYGKISVAVVVLGLAAFAAYLFWDGQREETMEKQSETLVGALDHLQSGNLDTASSALDDLAANGSGLPKHSAQMLRAGIEQEKGNNVEAAKGFAAVAADDDVPQVLRDLATIREISATYDARKPEYIIARLSPLAVPENPYYGSAGEMVAMAYLAQGKPKEAGNLFAAISKSEEVPDALRSRTRQMAGLLGVDAIEDVDELLEEVGADRGAAGPAGPGG